MKPPTLVCSVLSWRPEFDESSALGASACVSETGCLPNRVDGSSMQAAARRSATCGIARCWLS